MADLPIVNRAMVTAPKDYTLPQSQEIILKCVRATIDGSGAAGSFLPALQLVSNNGDVMWTAINASQTVTAGGSVNVTWFPGVSTATTSTAGSSLMAARVNIVGNQSIAQGDPGAIVTWGEAPIDNGTPTSFWTAGHPTRLTAPVNGIYLSMPTLQWDVPANAGDIFVGTYLYLNGASIILEHFLYEFDNSEANATVGDASYNLPAGHHGLFQLNAGDYLELLAYNHNPGGPARNLIDLRPTQNHYASWSLILVSTV